MLLIAPVILFACTGGNEVSLFVGPGSAPSPKSSHTLAASPSVTRVPTPAPIPTLAPTAEPTPAPTAPPAPPPTLPPPPRPPPVLKPYVPPPVEGPAALVVRKGNTSLMAVVFSFDAGSDTGHTAQILDTLASNGIRASFGITGRWAEQNPELLQRMVSEGHHLINHTYDHPSFTGRSSQIAALSRELRWAQLQRTEEIIAGLTGASTKPYFRPPFGDYDASVNADVGAAGYGYNVLWTVDSRGWMGWPAGLITQRCLQLAVPGAIYVFHVGSASQDGPALQGIIDGLRGRGYAIGAVPDVMAP